MPKIPVYQQQVGVAAGGLGPRASSAAFEAPGRATAAFGKQLGDMAFRLAEQERSREDRRVLQEESERAKEHFTQKQMEDQSANFTDAKSNMAQHKKNYLADLKAKGYSKRRLALVEREINSQFSIQSLEAQKNAFDRGTKLSTEADNKSLDSFRQTMRSSAPGSAPYMLAEANAAKVFDAAKLENRKLNYSPESFSQNVKVDTFNLKMASAQTTAELDAAFNELKKDPTLNPSVLTKAKSSVATAKSNLGTKLYEETSEVILEAELSSSEAQQVIDGFTKGEDFTVTRQNGDTIPFNAKDMPIGKRTKLISDAKKIQAGYQDEVRAANAASVIDGFESAGKDGALAIALDVYNTSEDVEDANESVLATARTMDAQAKIAAAAGDFESAQLLSETAQSLVTESFAGNPSLIENAGSIGKSANTILKSLAATGADIVDEQQRQVRHNAGVTAFKGGTLDNYAGIYSPDEEEKIMNEALEGLDLPMQLDLLARNNMTSPVIKGIISGASNEALYDPSPDIASVTQGLEAYRQVKARGKGVLADHTTDEGRAYFDSVMALEAIGVDTADAINKVTRAFNTDIDVEPRYATVKKEVDAILDASVTTIFGIEVSGQKVNNRPAIRQRVEDISKIYISMGTMSAEDAVKAAAKSIQDTHINLRGQLIPRRKSYPKDIERMVDLAAQNFFDKNEAMSAGDPGKITDLDVDNISLIPTTGRSDEWIVVVDNSIASFAGEPLYKIEDLEGLLAGDAKTVESNMIEENLKKRDLTDADQRRKAIQDLRKQASELTGGNLSRIRREQGAQAAEDAIAKRQSLLNEAEELQKLSVEFERMQRGS